MMNEKKNMNDYNIKKRYCPSKKENVVFKVENNAEHKEECLNEEHCKKNGGCGNLYNIKTT